MKNGLLLFEKLIASDKMTNPDRVIVVSRWLLIASEKYRIHGLHERAVQVLRELVPEEEEFISGLIKEKQKQKIASFKHRFTPYLALVTLLPSERRTLRKRLVNAANQ